VHRDLLGTQRILEQALQVWCACMGHCVGACRDNGYDASLADRACECGGDPHVRELRRGGTVFVFASVSIQPHPAMASPPSPPGRLPVPAATLALRTQAFIMNAVSRLGVGAKRTLLHTAACAVRRS
jgi:hypothetical protein